MKTKLTIRLNQEVIEKPSITPLVESLSGVINVPEDFDYKKEYANYLEEKYK
ncbi:MAG: DUF6364 family protein [Bacteroidota bacterium]|nr:DUF6364 family protein [Bacteroidota bacterium]